MFKLPKNLFFTVLLMQHNKFNKFNGIFKNFLKISIFIIPLNLILINCASSPADKDPVTGEKVIIDPNPKNRAREYADKGGGLLNNIINKKESNTFEFGTSNVLWRATLKSLEFLPILNADYSGGIIIYDWYSENNSNEQIKITVRFLSNEVKSESILVTSHKKICINEKCSISKLNDNLSSEIKDSILTAARALKIEEAKKEKK